MTELIYYIYLIGIIMIVKETHYQEVYMMIKVNILNLSGFLETINQCKGRVSMLAPDGEKA